MGVDEDAERTDDQVGSDALLSFEFRQLVYFCAVVDNRSFSRASSSLHVAQPWLSAQVRKLEARVGYTLLERGTPLSTTPAGSMLYVRASRFLRDARGVVATFSSLEKRGPVPVVPAEANSLRCEITVYGLLITREASGLDLLTEVAADTELRTDTTVNHVGTVERVSRGITDAALVLGPVPAQGLRRLPISAEEVVLVLPEDDPLAAADVVRFRDLAGRKVAGPQRGNHPWMHDQVYGRLQKAGAEIVENRDTTIRDNFDYARDAGVLALTPTSGIRLLSDGLTYRPLGPHPLYVEAWWIMAENTTNPHMLRLWERLEGRRIASRWLRI